MLNAFLTSSLISAQSFHRCTVPLAAYSTIVSTALIASTVGTPLRNPYLLSAILLLTSRKVFILHAIIRSNNFRVVSIMHRGLLLDDSSTDLFSPFLISTYCALFYLVGNYPLDKHSMNALSRISGGYFITFLSTSSEIPSGPRVFPILIRLPATTSLSILKGRSVVSITGSYIISLIGCTRKSPFTIASILPCTLSSVVGYCILLMTTLYGSPHGSLSTELQNSFQLLSWLLLIILRNSFFLCLAISRFCSQFFFYLFAVR